MSSRTYRQWLRLLHAGFSRKCSERDGAENTCVEGLVCKLHVKWLGIDAPVYFRVERLGDMVAHTVGTAHIQRGDTVWATPA